MEPLKFSRTAVVHARPGKRTCEVESVLFKKGLESKVKIVDPFDLRTWKIVGLLTWF